MFVRNFRNVTALFAVVMLTAACSSGFGQSSRTRLTGPDDSQYTSVRNQQLARSEQRLVDNREPAQPGGCADEPVAHRPYPTHVTVVRGENLCRIAKRYQTTVQAIVDTNRLPSPLLAVGTQLRLPSPQYYSQSPFGQLRRR